jgi:uncharacterized protein (TIGR03437 family)
MATPAVVVTANGPADVRSKDFGQVTITSPAHPGEILKLFADGLGPLRPADDKNAPRTANSPMEATVDGKGLGSIRAREGSVAHEYAPNCQRQWQSTPRQPV